MNAILLVYNTSIPSSHADAITYLTRRNLPVNLLGVNFGTVPTAVSQAQALASVYTVQSLVWNGVADTTFNGTTLYWGLYWTAQKYAVDGVILSTYTPLVYVNTQAPLNRPLPACFGSIVHLARFNNGLSFVPNGRLGSPAVSTNNFDFTTEMTTPLRKRARQPGGAQCHRSGARYNKGEPHLLSTATSIRSAALLAGTWWTTRSGTRVAYYQSLMSYARDRNGMNWTHRPRTRLQLQHRAAPTDFALGFDARSRSRSGACLLAGGHQ